MALQAERAAASTLSIVSCDTLENLWARFASANSRMYFLTLDLLISVFMVCMVLFRVEATHSAPCHQGADGVLYLVSPPKVTRLIDVRMLFDSAS